MKVCGIVVEYNPFHNGHVYHIEKARELTKCDVLIAIMSPTFMQRGEPAIINKFERVKFALKYNVDLVIELPSICAIQSANHFAAGALQILNELKIDYLVFGSESNNVDMLKEAAKLSHSLAYQNLVKDYLKNGQRYATACNLAFKDYGIDEVNLANDILGLAYVQEIVKHDYKIQPLTIQRTNEYLSQKVDSDIASASAIRNALDKNQDISNLTPMNKVLFDKKNELVYFEDFFSLLKYQLAILSIEDIQKIHGFEEGLEYLFKNKINEVNNIEDFINAVSSKRYPKTRIQRAIIYLLCNIKKQDIKTELDYIRVLGMSAKGQQYLKNLKEATSYKIITTFSKHKSTVLDIEHKISHVYSMAKTDVNYLYNLEYQQSVIIKEEENGSEKTKL